MNFTFEFDSIDYLKKIVTSFLVFPYFFLFVESEFKENIYFDIIVESCKIFKIKKEKPCTGCLN